MGKTISSDLNRAGSMMPSKRIRNTFAPNCGNKYFEPEELFGLCRCGFPYENLPEEAKKMLDAFLVEYKKKCTGPNDKPKPLPDLPVGKGIVYG